MSLYELMHADLEMFLLYNIEEVSSDQIIYQLNKLLAINEELAMAK